MWIWQGEQAPVQLGFPPVNALCLRWAAQLRVGRQLCYQMLGFNEQKLFCLCSAGTAPGEKAALAGWEWLFVRTSQSYPRNLL